MWKSVQMVQCSPFPVHSQLTREHTAVWPATYTESRTALRLWLSEVRECNSIFLKSDPFTDYESSSGFTLLPSELPRATVTPTGPIRVNVGEPINLECQAAGEPRPSVTWHRLDNNRRTILSSPLPMESNALMQVHIDVPLHPFCVLMP